MKNHLLIIMIWRHQIQDFAVYAEQPPSISKPIVVRVSKPIKRGEYLGLIRKEVK